MGYFKMSFILLNSVLSFSGINQWNQMELNWRSLSLMSLSSQSKISFKLQLYYYHGKLVKEKSLYKSCINFS